MPSLWAVALVANLAMKSLTNAQQIAVTKHPGLACNLAILQPRTHVVDFRFACRNPLYRRPLPLTKEPAGLTAPSPFGIPPLWVLQFGTFSLFSGGESHFVLTFSSKCGGTRLSFVVPPYYYFTAGDYAFRGTSSL